MEPDKIQKMLFMSASDKYGDKYIEHLLEQYKIYIASAEKISDRRQKTNEFFLGLNTALVALLGFVVMKITQEGIGSILILSSLAGISICYLWYRIIRSFDGLNEGKFNVIHMIEARLPLALYDTEWEILGRGKNKKIYWPFTRIERWVPWIFIAIYFSLMISVFPWRNIISFFLSLFRVSQ
jgi:hypothetical protein